MSESAPAEFEVYRSRLRLLIAKMINIVGWAVFLAFAAAIYKVLDASWYVVILH